MFGEHGRKIETLTDARRPLDKVVLSPYISAMQLCGSAQSGTASKQDLLADSHEIINKLLMAQKMLEFQGLLCKDMRPALTVNRLAKAALSCPMITMKERAKIIINVCKFWAHLEPGHYHKRGYFVKYGCFTIWKMIWSKFHATPEMALIEEMFLLAFLNNSQCPSYLVQLITPEVITILAQQGRSCVIGLMCLAQLASYAVPDIGSILNCNPLPGDCHRDLLPHQVAAIFSKAQLQCTLELCCQLALLKNQLHMKPKEKASQLAICLTLLFLQGPSFKFPTEHVLCVVSERGKPESNGKSTSGPAISNGVPISLSTLEPYTSLLLYTSKQHIPQDLLRVLTHRNEFFPAKIKYNVNLSLDTTLFGLLILLSSHPLGTTDEMPMKSLPAKTCSKLVEALCKLANPTADVTFDQQHHRVQPSTNALAASCVAHVTASARKVDMIPWFSRSKSYLTKLLNESVLNACQISAELALMYLASTEMKKLSLHTATGRTLPVHIAHSAGGLDQSEGLQWLGHRLEHELNEKGFSVSMSPVSSQFDQRLTLDKQDSFSSSHSDTGFIGKPMLRASKERVCMDIHLDLEACSVMFAVLNRWSALSPRLRVLLEAASNSGCIIVPIANDPSSVHRHGWLASLPFEDAIPSPDILSESALPALSSSSSLNDLARSVLWSALKDAIVTNDPEISDAENLGPLSRTGTTSTTSSFNQILARRHGRRMSEPGI